MLDSKMEAALNEQIKWEFFSGYLYLAKAAYFDDLGLSGFTQWMKFQAAEELSHAAKMFNYLCEAGGRARLEAIDKPEFEWDSPLACMQAGLEHEKHVTKRINDLMDLAVDLKDHATSAFLQFFITEQVEEEASFDEIVRKLKMVGDGGGLYMVDKEVGARVFTWPVDVQ